jgi:hypothetical protein
VALALERRRASGEFPRFDPAPSSSASQAPSLANLAAPRARGALARDGARAASARTSPQAPLQPLPPVRYVPPLPRLHEESAADASSADEEKTAVHHAVRAPGGLRGATTPSAPVRLGPKRALLAAMASVLLLLQLWMFGVVRSHHEKARSTSPAESEVSSKQMLRARDTASRPATGARSPQRRTAEPIRAPAR